MSRAGFEIEITRQGWINELEDDPGDLCSHGDIRLVMGEMELAPGDGTGEYTISTSALALLRTLESDHSPEHPVADQLILHCGMIDMLSCPIGFDWRVTHVPGELVCLDEVVRDGVAHFGMVVELPEEQYRLQVGSFAAEAKKLFEGAKKVPGSPYEQELYDEFWREYDERLSRLSL